MPSDPRLQPGTDEKSGLRPGGLGSALAEPRSRRFWEPSPTRCRSPRSEVTGHRRLPPSIRRGSRSGREGRCRARWSGSPALTLQLLWKELAIRQTVFVQGADEILDRFPLLPGALFAYP